MPRSDETNKVIRVLSKTEREAFLQSLSTWMTSIERGDVIVMKSRPNWPKGRPGSLRSRRVSGGKDDGMVYIWLEPEALTLPEPAEATVEPPTQEQQDLLLEEGLDEAGHYPVGYDDGEGMDDVYKAAEEAFKEMR